MRPEPPSNREYNTYILPMERALTLKKDHLTQWEESFFRSIISASRAPSVKQKAVIYEILKRHDIAAP